MQWGSVVWFSDHPRPFLVRDEYCSDPECTCNEIGLTLQEISDCGKVVPQPLSLRLRVDLVTWEECDPPQRSPLSAGWVRQFLSQFPTDRRAELKARFEKKKQTARRIAEYRIDPHEVTDGILFSYANLLDDQGALTGGGRSYTYRLVHQNGEYLVEDLYCPNPTCDCREVHIQFWKRDSQERDGIEQVTISQSFLGKVTFTGQRSVVVREECSPAVAEAVLAAWWDRYRDDLPMLKDRYQQVKKIGQRSLDAAEVSSVVRPLTVAQRAALPVTSSVVEFLEDDPLSSRKRVGRNDLCPCGSGKKYKRCCGRPR